MSESINEFLRDVETLTRAESGAWLALASVDSTNSTAKRIARLGVPSIGRSPVIVLAWHQTAGRGRNGRRWECRPGSGLLASILVQPRDRESLATLPLATGVALAETTSTIIRSDVRLRWPNDLYVGDAKLGGILIESMSQGPTSLAVIGFGVNYEDPPPRIEDRRTTSLSRQANDLPSLAQVAVRAAGSVVRALCLPTDTGEVIARAEQLSSHQIGSEVRLKSNSREVIGKYLGLDQRGLLVLETSRGLESVATGEIVQT